MGINVHIQRLEGNRWEDHPDWDSFRHAGDREISRIVRENGGSTYSEDSEVFRPNDLDALSKADWPEYNPDRWKGFIEILRDPQWWVYLSY